MRPNADPMEALMRRVTVAPDGCWVRDGAAVRGYPVVKVQGRQHRAARLSFELHVGPIPDGLTIDHLCRNTRCVNPDHLEAVSNAENARRGRKATKPTHCPRGHAYDEHGYVYQDRTHCRVCRAAWMRRWKRANPERTRELRGGHQRSG